ncbi:MerR family transcriptional regulator [Falsiroseomonas tokyonensis]|uniref:Helix-turn-helix domain-containing protein n=1 Tax=Falsiroseomonas tokyonensis TaxID=430521 RepID=A0ABV7C6M1_9PROT|nr:helix-turn-helix domain-containing protein [Falsiroseomonas tokyonensis]MBU8541940.1 helix-turn-helix domain-containing protein [Falsiroseomonas tokyonensis]
MDRSQQGISIGDLSRRTEVNIETIRYYEKIGLLPVPGRTEGRHRVYGPAHVARLTFVRRSREVGFSLDEVRSLLKLVDGGHSSCSDVQAVTLDHLHEVRKKIADLQRLERILSEVSSRCQGGSVPDCPIVEALYAPAHGAEA